MSWQDCIAEIRAAAQHGPGGEKVKLSDDQIERLLDRIVREARRRSGIGSRPPRAFAWPAPILSSAYALPA